MEEQNQKDEVSKRLRQMIKHETALASETDEAEALLCALSFQSTLMPERHVWIDTNLDGIGIDLEDRLIDDEWDNAYARVKVLSLKNAAHITQVWLSGGDLLEWYTNVNKQYGFVQRKIAWPVGLPMIKEFA